MPAYMYQGSYSQDAIRALVSNPVDRSAAARAVIEANGGTMTGCWMAFGEDDLIVIADMPDDESMAGAAESVTEEENLKLVQKISWLGLIGNVAPMLGLFGTVLGMVLAFGKIAGSATQPTPAELAGGIYTALVTTVWGLVAAIPALTFYFVFKMKVQRLSFELSAVAMEIVERFKPMAQGGK